MIPYGFYNLPHEKSKYKNKYVQMYRNILIIITLNLTIAINSQAQLGPSFLKDFDKVWVDSIFNTMTLDQKIGQLLMPRAHYSGKPIDQDLLAEWVDKYHIGGLVFFAGQPTRQAQVVNFLQSRSSVPMMIGQDFEWGLAMRLDSTVRFPYAIGLGAIDGNDGLLENMGAEIGRQCRRMGVHINYAPVVDINNNPRNPVINFRSFGEKKELVAQKGLSVMRGMQNQRIICTAKHFPGHGDTDTDSHLDLPVIQHDKKRIYNTEIYPFKTLIDNGLSGVMTAHLHIPAIDSEKNMASTLSRKTLQGVLRKDLGFDGLVFTDAIDMKGITKHFPKGEAVVMALSAGNDVIETFVDVPEAVEAIKKALEEGKLSTREIDQKVIKILKAKSWLGLQQFRPIDVEYLLSDLNTHDAEVLNYAMAEQMLTLLINKNRAIPVQDLSSKIAIVCLNANDNQPVSDFFNLYTSVKVVNVPKTQMNASSLDSIMNIIKDVDQVFVSVLLQQVRPNQQYGITPEILQAINALKSHPFANLLWFGNPYGLELVGDLQNFKSVLVGYQDTKYAQEAAAQAVFGAIPIRGKLPVSVGPDFPAGTGIAVESADRLKYGWADLSGIDNEKLSIDIDSIMDDAVSRGYFPGGVVQVIHKGQVIHRKAYGGHIFASPEDRLPVDDAKSSNTNSNKDDAMDDFSGQGNGTKSMSPGINPENQNQRIRRVHVDDLYDMASITKIAASGLAVMAWMSEGKFALDSVFSKYYPGAQNTSMENLTFRSLLTHTAGLKAWIPFWKNTIDSVQTLRNALQQHPEWASQTICRIGKRNIFQILFGMKQKIVVNEAETIKNGSQDFWKKAVNTRSITFKSGLFSFMERDGYNVRIHDSMWMSNSYRDTILNTILNCPITPEQGYVYSDMHFYFYPEICKRITGLSWEDYLYKLYARMGAGSLKYNPLNHFGDNQIIPTEYDSLFRQTLIHGYVHDEGAIMMGGISGHAGLFGNANDLSKVMYMFMKNGSFGKERILKTEVVRECTSYQFPEKGIRRAIAFDKKDFNPEIKNAPLLSSANSFGHSGFTGTFAWADPEHELVYVLLTNRVNPTRENQQMLKNNFRQQLGDLIYKYIFPGSGF